MNQSQSLPTPKTHGMMFPFGLALYRHSVVNVRDCSETVKFSDSRIYPRMASPPECLNFRPFDTGSQLTSRDLGGGWDVWTSPGVGVGVGGTLTLDAVKLPAGTSRGLAGSHERGVPLKCGAGSAGPAGIELALPSRGPAPRPLSERKRRNTSAK